VSLLPLVLGHRLVVCVGPGGVGKTTVSAAIGLLAARAGKRAFVLTIDPARRLADALALDGLDDTSRRVPLERLQQAADTVGELSAAMVDTGTSFDALIERISPDEATRDRVLANRVYRAVSRSLARSHAYVAMERLHHALTVESHDLVVLDTPPARNAIDILDAPRQLSRFLDAKIVDWLLPGRTPTGIAGLLARGGQMAVSLLRRVTGPELLDAIVEFLEVFAELRPGFLQRAESIDTTLRAPSTAYVLVASGSPSAIDDAMWLRGDLQRREIEIDAVVCNASYLPVDPVDLRRIVDGVPPLAFEALPPGLSQDADLLATLRALRRTAAGVNAEAQTFVDGMAAELPDRTTIVRTPRFAQEVRDLPALARLADYLERPGVRGRG
jgi:anion-transporting  ArsA/GET3 family ATPase